MLIAYQVVLILISLFFHIDDNVYCETWQGFIDEYCQFYFLFLAPIMIAYSHRAT